MQLLHIHSETAEEGMLRARAHTHTVKAYGTLSSDKFMQ